MFKIITGFGALIVASAAVAASPATDDKTKNPDDRVICQKEEQIGSRLAAKKVCLTAKEWKDRAQANREETERVQSGARAASSN